MAIRGFFSKELSSEKKKTKLPKKLEPLKEPECIKCRADKGVISPCMKFSGRGELDILFLGQSPGEQEDLEGTQFVGPAGKLLRKTLKGIGKDLDQDFFIHNVFNCRPVNKDGYNRTPTLQELEYCRPTYIKTINELNPKIIIFLGADALKSFLMYKSNTVTKHQSMDFWRGRSFVDTTSGARCYATYHPSFINRDRNDNGWSAYEHIFQRDIATAVFSVRIYTAPRRELWTNRVHLLATYEEVITELKKVPGLMNDDDFAYDYETTCLKPVYPYSEIVSISFAYGAEGQEQSFSFPLNHIEKKWSALEKEHILELWTEIIAETDFDFIGQNLIMEERWNQFILGKDTSDYWRWDTMQTAHILDERKGITSLDMQVFEHFGYEYGKSMGHYKKGVDDYSPNRMKKAPLDKLLEYGGLDSLFTLMIKRLQETAININGLEEANDLWIEGTKTFSKLECKGMVVDREYYLKLDKRIEAKIKILFIKLGKTEGAKKFKERTGKEFTLSDPDMRVLLFDILKHKCMAFTEKTQIPSVNEADLGSLMHLPFVSLRKQIKKLTALKNTHLSHFINGMAKDKNGDWRIYPNQNLHLARSYRSTNSDPNFQNIPKHDPETGGMIRKGIIAPPGFKIAEPDYGSMEVRMAAIVYDDPVLKEEVRKSFDPHNEWSIYLGLDKQKSAGLARFDAKNGFVFPLIYNSWYDSIWKDLVSRGYDIDIELVKKAEAAFWYKYSVMRENQLKAVEKYYKTGYVHMAWGHKRGGFLKKTVISNSMVQGPAFHCLLWAIIEAQKVAEEEEWRSSINGQIHDAPFMYLWPEEEQHVIETVTDIMENKIREANPWISVPLKCEWNISSVNGNWTQLTEIKNMNEYFKNDCIIEEPPF